MRKTQVLPFKLYLVTLALGLSLVVGTQGCKSKSKTSKTPVTTKKSTPKVQEPKVAKKNVVLFLGDSLTAGYRLAASEAYPYLINSHWKKQGFPWRARNAGVSGDTSAGVIRRLDWVLSKEVVAVFLCIGANDGLRGQSIKQLQKNLSTIIQAIQKKNIKVILAGITLPRNYGKNYYSKFENTYAKLAKQYKLPMMPFLLKDVAGIKKLNLSDGIHPNTKGHQIVAKNVLAFFKKQSLFPRSPATK